MSIKKTALGVLAAFVVLGITGLGQAEDLQLLTEKNVTSRSVVIDGDRYTVNESTRFEGFDGERLSFAAFPEPEFKGSIPVEFDAGSGGVLAKLRAVRVPE